MDQDLFDDEDLELDFDINYSAPNAASNATESATAVASGTNDANRDSMLELERELADQTKDITQRFEGERRPQPAGLDQALGFGNSHRQSGSQLPPTAPKYAARGGGFVTGFDPLSKEEIAKKANRAQRFGGSAPAASTTTTDANMDEQESGMDVDDASWSRPQNLPQTPPRTSTIRPEAVHVYGTDAMSTKDVLQYFEVYGPSHVEWIDDSSCNVIFKDNFSAKRALYYQLADSNVTFGEDGEEDSSVAEPSRENTTVTADGTLVPDVVLVPKSKNRLQRAKEYIPVQRQHQPIIQNNNGLFLRYATDIDVKERGAASKSQYYAIHGREEPSSTGRSGHRGTNGQQHDYGRRSRADDDEVWNRGRGITTMSRLQRRMERGSQSPSLSPPRGRQGRSWSRNRHITGSHSRSSSSNSRRDSRSRSPGHTARRDHGSRSPDSKGHLHADDYEKRGRRDIFSRLGGPVNEDDAAPMTSRMNSLASDFMQELESTFSKREKAIPKTRTLYSDFYEKEIVSEAAPSSRYRDDNGRGRDGGGRRRRREERDSDGRRSPALFSGASGNDRSSREEDVSRRLGSSPSLTSSENHREGSGGRSRRDKGDRAEALRALDARLGLPNVDEFGREVRD